MTDFNEEDKLERMLNRALHALPPRRAPLSLESRVFRELDRRAALPWWRRSFAHWPVIARCVLIVVCGALVGLTMLDGAMSFSWLNPIVAVMTSASGLAISFERATPPPWLYVTLGVGAMLYVILFALGAAAYRTLYLRPLNHR
jgi:hypothetical protein